MLKKINITLALLCVLGAIFIGGVAIYDHVSDVSTGKVADKLQEMF